MSLKNAENLHNFVMIFPLFIVDTAHQMNAEKKGYKIGQFACGDVENIRYFEDNGIGFKSQEEIIQKKKTKQRPDDDKNLSKDLQLSWTLVKDSRRKCFSFISCPWRVFYGYKRRVI